ncbi:MAG: FtsX-like permease family protein [Defluviitaleaceae bacterium]|nr:FtsX-like permease family protein [Defluviitaleaceae bacterium]
MILLKKALRAMWKNKKTYIACALLISVGIFIYVSMGITSFAFEDSMHIYYRDYRMADVFSRISRAPRSIEEDLAQTPGINTVSARITYDARAELKGVDRRMTLRLMSAPYREDSLNLPHITYGDTLVNDNDIILGEDFFLAHELQIGNSIDIIIRGRQFSFNIAAAALSPEFVYAIQDITQLYPDDLSFGYAYINYDVLASMLDMRGMVNDISFLLSPGYEFDDVKVELEDRLTRYGLISLISRDDQISHSLLEMQIQSVQSMSQSLSIVFVAGSMVMLYLMLKRIIEQDRGQIGTLKAFGFKNSEILLHYLTYGAVTGLLGGIIGVILGYLSTGYMIDIYSDFFKMPEVVSYQSGAIIMQALLIALAGGVLGSFMGAYSAVNLSPAQAMRPEAPKPVKYDILSLFPFIKIFLNSRGFIAVRSIDRNRVRSVFIIAGVMFSFGIIAFMNSMTDMVDMMMIDQFERSRMYDGRINFVNPISVVHAVSALHGIEGVELAEAVFETPVMLINRHIEEGALITGVNPYSDLFQIFDMNTGTHIVPSRGGLVLSLATAENLAVSKGDRVYISSPLLAYNRPIYIREIISEMVGGGSYMPLYDLADFLDIPPMASSVILRTDSLSHVVEYLREGENILSIDDINDSQAAMLEMMATYDVLMRTMWIMGIFVAFAIIYNTSSISLNERKREYATLRVLGLEVGEVAEIMSFEYWLLAIIGMLLGVPFTRLLRMSMVEVIDVDLFAIPLHTEPGALIAALFGCSVAVFISNYISKRAIRKFDIVEVLKERE